MATFKTQQVHGTCVWRISERAPMGEWIDLSKRERVPAEVTAGGWVASSLDLLHGADVIEDDKVDTVPSGLLEQRFSPQARAPSHTPGANRAKVERPPESPNDGAAKSELFWRDGITPHQA